MYDVVSEGLRTQFFSDTKSSAFIFKNKCRKEKKYQEKLTFCFGQA